MWVSCQRKRENFKQIVVLISFFFSSSLDLIFFHSDVKDLLVWVNGCVHVCVQVCGCVLPSTSVPQDNSQNQLMYLCSYLVNCKLLSECTSLCFLIWSPLFGWLQYFSGITFLIVCKSSTYIFFVHGNLWLSLPLSTDLLARFEFCEIKLF